MRSATAFVLSNLDRLVQAAALIDAGKLRVEVTRRIALSDLPTLHAEAASGRIEGKVIVTIEAASGRVLPAQHPACSVMQSTPKTIVLGLEDGPHESA
jgi:hypothetical protein